MGYKVKWVEDNLGVTRKALRGFEEAGLGERKIRKLDESQKHLKTGGFTSLK